MKRRKWWLIGCTLAFLIACWITWRWSERPPYKFLEGATLEYSRIRTGFGQDTVLTDYRVAQSFDHVVKSARDELEPIQWMGKQYGKDIAFSPHSDIDEILAESVNISPPVSVGDSVRITVARHATWADRVRVWLYHALRP